MIESHVSIWFEYKILYLETRDLIWIWFQLMWFDLWFDQITNFSNLGQRIIVTLWCFTAINYSGNSTISNLCTNCWYVRSAIKLFELFYKSSVNKFQFVKSGNFLHLIDMVIRFDLWFSLKWFAIRGSDLWSDFVIYPPMTCILNVA